MNSPAARLEATRPDLTWACDLQRLGQAIGHGESASSAYAQLLRYLVEGFGADSGSLSMVQGEPATLMLVAGIGVPPEVLGRPVVGEDSVLAWVAAHGEPLILNADPGAELIPPLRRRAALAAEVARGDRHSALCWPLRVDGAVVGVLALNRGPGRPPFRPEDRAGGEALVSLVGLAAENARLHAEQAGRIAALSEKNREISEVNRRLSEAQAQLLQSEKMASVGQLAAGVAHEINNPVGYVQSNLGTLERYVADLLELLGAYEAQLPALVQAGCAGDIQAVAARIDPAYLRQDLADLVRESRQGLDRVRGIIQSLKDFSRAGGSEELQWADLHEGMESTLNVVWNELKYKAEVKREYGELPRVRCLPSQLNQVFMNLLVNAGQALEDRGTITIRSGVDGPDAWVEVEDTGKGIPPEVLDRIFEPFFTTKPVGKGTGLGLSLSWSIVAKHGGRIEVRSEPGRGSCFRVRVPVQGPAGEPA